MTIYILHQAVFGLEEAAFEPGFEESGISISRKWGEPCYRPRQRHKIRNVNLGVDNQVREHPEALDLDRVCKSHRTYSFLESVPQEGWGALWW